MEQFDSERDILLEKINRNWASLIEKLRSFDDEEMNIPNAIGIWTLKDLVGHLETWDRIAISKISYAEAGDHRPWYEIEEQPFDSIDTFNEYDAEQNRHKTLDQLWAELHARHDELLERIRSSAAVTDDLIREDTWAHYEVHLNDIRSWQQHRVQQH